MATTTHERISVYCVDDHALVARGLRAAVQLEPDLEWAGWQASADGLVEAFDRHKPDVILLDVDLPGADSFIELTSLIELRSEARVVMLTAFVRDRYVEAAIAAGARGYVSKAEEFESIFDAIRAVAAGRFVFPDEYASRYVEEGGRLRLLESADTGFASLTARETQVLRLIATGCSTKDIADQIHRSVKRVESIRTTIMRKLGCSDRLELTRLAIREGLIEP